MLMQRGIGQVMMPLLPEYLLTACFAAIRDDLASLALHPSANYGVQAALAACITPDQVLDTHTHTLLFASKYQKQGVWHEQVWRKSSHRRKEKTVLGLHFHLT